METYTNIYATLCSHENLELAFRKARKGKGSKPYVNEFESDLTNNLKNLKYELESFNYIPSPANTFVIRDPKTRRIHASHFRDRIVHHALCNVIMPIFEKCFIYDSFANQKHKGTHLAIMRFKSFSRKTGRINRHSNRGGEGTQNNEGPSFGYVFKADIRHYFDTIDHETLLNIIKLKIKDPDIIWLIKMILTAHNFEIEGKGMSLGNLTSQSFANVYLNELDQFVKHKLKAKYYIRYVDDFVILHKDKNILKTWRSEISDFLQENLKVDLHPDKSKIIPIRKGITFLGFRVFPDFKLIKKSNVRRIWKRIEIFKEKYDKREITQEYVVRSMHGWLAYAKFANTYKFRKRVHYKLMEILAN